MRINKKEIVIIAIIITIFITFFGSRYIALNKSTNQKETFEKVESLEENNDLEEKEDEDIYVHICGRVKNPGLVKLKANTRVIDAVNIAGGMYEDADIDKINLAKKLSDEDRIYIPKIGEENISALNTEKNNSSIININTATKEELQNLPGIGPKMAEKIIEYRDNKNFKKIDEIKDVPGIGEKKFNEIEKFISIN